MIEQIIVADVFDGLAQLPNASVNMCVTSPPYWSLRDYGTGSWLGGNDVNCDHRLPDSYLSHLKAAGDYFRNSHVASRNSISCLKCGAIRIDMQIGLEESPEEYVKTLVAVFREVWRVLKDDGTLWLVIGDTYNGYRGNAYSDTNGSEYVGFKNQPTRDSGYGLECKDLKPKDLVGIPWLLAFALRADGWYLRQDIIWAKPCCMPEAVKDRCTKSHEYIFLLSKSAKYYYDYQAIMELATYDGRQDVTLKYSEKYGSGVRVRWQEDESGNKVRNKRSVWTIPPARFDESHFATFPTELIRPCILAGSPIGGVVLDPFFGAGTTGVVAKEEQRGFIGIELNPEYAKMANKRISKAVVQYKLPLAVEDELREVG